MLVIDSLKPCISWKTYCLELNLGKLTSISKWEVFEEYIGGDNTSYCSYCCFDWNSFLKTLDTFFIMEQYEVYVNSEYVSTFNSICQSLFSFLRLLIRIPSLDEGQKQILTNIFTWGNSNKIFYWFSRSKMNDKKIKIN